MTVFFLILGIVLVLISCVAYYQSLHRVTHMTDQLTQHAHKLQASLVSAKQLREEIDTLQSKYSRTFTDPVTQLPGWRLFEDRLARHITESMRQHFSFGVLYVDLDDFKLINEGLSYDVGDALLQEVAKKLLTCVRQVDTVSRFAKDTFVILLARLAKPETAALVAQRILSSLHEAIQLNHHEITITACIGIAIYPTDAQTAPTLLSCAEQAMRLAKAQGEHHYRYYQEEMHRQSQRELAIYDHLSRETLLDELVLRYQAVVDMDTQQTYCLEASVSLQHASLGIIQEDELLQYAEKQRKANVIYEWMVREVCHHYMAWRAAGLKAPYTCLTVSLKQFTSSQFICRFSQILQEVGCDPGAIILSVKDSHADVALDALERSCNMLNYLGVKIAISHFGSGRFPLYLLKQLPITYLKVDAALIMDVVYNSQTAVLVSSLLTLATNMQMVLWMAGVTSQHQQNKLVDLGCRYLQGEVIGVPATAAEITRHYALER